MDAEELELVMEDADSSDEKAISHLEAELTKIRAGKANLQWLMAYLLNITAAPTPIRPGCLM
jgi:ribosome recycling factor